MDNDEIEVKLDALQNEFRVFRDNHFYHMVRNNDKAHDDIMDQLKDKKLWIAIGVIGLTGLMNLVKV